MGVDGISLWFVLLSTLLTPIVIISSWHSVKERVREYMIAFLVMDTLMVGVFCALDMVLFYAFFEGILIPMYLIIGIWGGPRKIYSAFKFFLYTLLGSVLFLLAIIAMYLQVGTTNIPDLMAADFDPGLQRWLWLAMFASFAVKVPMWPFHTWLPDAHVEAPTGGSVLPGWRIVEVGRIWILAFFTTHAARRIGVFRATGLRPFGDRDRLHLAGRLDANRYEEADRLFIGGAYGHRYHWDFHAERLGYPGQHHSNAVTWLCLSSTLHVCWRRL